MITSQATVARWAFVAVLPFWSVYLAHVLLGPNRPTGFIILDCAYYCANGREIFERGNGLAYCNPYDPDPAAPVIYWHWLPWLLGAGTKLVGLDPGFTLCLLGAIGGLAYAYLTFRLVEAVLPSSRYLVACYLFTMWGGGLLVVTAMATNLALGRPITSFLLQHDPFDGMWFLNWGRNLILPTEAIYHALVAGAWLAVVRERLAAAVGCIAALAATHPFSGIQHLLVLGAWLAWLAVTRLRLEWPAAAHLTVFLAFCSYYFGYLPRFPQHQDIHGRWSLEWNLSLVSLLAAGAPVFALAAARCWRDRHHWRPEMTFFLIAAAVSLCLAKHELFLPARQPLHFTRGYTWLPLCLLGLPLVQRGLGWALSPPVHPVGGLARHTGRIALTAALAGLAVLDNTTFLVDMWNQPADRPRDCHMSPALADAFGFLERAGMNGTLLVISPNDDSWEDYNYLSATYTRMTPLHGHPYLTPGYDEIVAETREWYLKGRPSPLLDRVDVMIVPHDFSRKLPGGLDAWTPIHTNDAVAVLKRVRLPWLPPLGLFRIQPRLDQLGIRADRELKLPEGLVDAAHFGKCDAVGVVGDIPPGMQLDGGLVVLE